MIALFIFSKTNSNSSSNSNVGQVTVQMATPVASVQQTQVVTSAPVQEPTPPAPVQTQAQINNESNIDTYGQALAKIANGVSLVQGKTIANPNSVLSSISSYATHGATTNKAIMVMYPIGSGTDNILANYVIAVLGMEQPLAEAYEQDYGSSGSYPIAYFVLGVNGTPTDTYVKLEYNDNSNTFNVVEKHASPKYANAFASISSLIN